MDSDIITALRVEKAELERKLEAVKAMLVAYGDAPHVERRKENLAQDRPSALVTPARSKQPLERFSPYGADLIRGAMDIIRARPPGPVPTRDIVEALESKGFEVRGTDKINAVSALLARSADVQNHGRRGWTLAAPPMVSTGSTVNAGPAGPFVGPIRQGFAGLRGIFDVTDEERPDIEASLE